MHRDRADEALVRELTEQHLRYTGSTLALELLDNWATARKKFVKVFPLEYKRALTEMFVKRAVAAGIASQEGARGSLMGKVTGFLELQRIPGGLRSRYRCACATTASSMSP